MKSFTEELHMRPYMVTKKCVLNKTFPLGQFMLHFTIFYVSIQCFYIYEMITKKLVMAIFAQQETILDFVR